jgi:aryl-alcohol dehydrogenase-like predicted oxidoreductase
MGDGRSQRIGRIGLIAARRRQQHLDHGLHLLLAGMADTDHAFLDVIGRIFGNLQIGLCGSQERNRARMTELQSRRGIFGHESLLDRDSGRAVFGDHRAQRAMQGVEPSAEIGLGIAGEHAVADMGQPGAGHVNHAPAHAGEAGIEAQNANRCGDHRPFVPFPFPWFNARTPRMHRKDRLMDRRRLGEHGPEVSAIGLGCMGMSDFYGPADEGESIATIHAALDAGIDLIDTGDFYGMGHNEMLIGRALKGKRDKALISVKFGALRGPDGNWSGYDARPAAIKNFLAYTLRRLGTDHIDIYRPARLDPNVPIEETAGAIADLIKAGYIRWMGLSEVSAETVARANAVTPICDLQIEYSMITRMLEDKILPRLRELGVGVTAYGVLSRGLISTATVAGQTKERPFFPRFTGQNLEKNASLVRELDNIAKGHGISVAQLAIAWALGRGDDIVPLIGARSRIRLAETLGALDVKLGELEYEAIDKAVTGHGVAGTRYAAHQMAMLDSEKGA